MGRCESESRQNSDAPDERIALGLEVGGEIVGEGREIYLDGEKSRDLKGKKHQGLMLIGKGLIIQNPHSGLGLGIGARRYRFPDISARCHWREPNLRIDSE